MSLTDCTAVPQTHSLSVSPWATPIIRATSHINPLLPLSLLTTDFSVSQKETIMMTTTTDLR